MNRETLYEILKLRRQATTDEIHRAWRICARQHHPDLGAGDAARMRLVNEAHEVLMDPARRAVYDATLPPPPVRLPQELLRRASFTAWPASIAGHEAGLCTGSHGWHADGAAPWRLEITFEQPALLTALEAVAAPLPYAVKRAALDAVERHRLLGLTARGWSEIHAVRLATALDRDISVRFAPPAGPVRGVCLETVAAPYPPGWMQMRLYGFFAVDGPA